MYAIIRTGGKQARVAAGDVLDVERLKLDGEDVSFTPLLVVADDGSTITGRSDLERVKVHAKILGETRGDKIDVFRYKPKTGYRKQSGHRQLYTRIQITEIEIPKKRPARSAKAAKAPAETENGQAEPGVDTEATSGDAAAEVTKAPTSGGKTEVTKAPAARTRKKTEEKTSAETEPASAGEET